MSSEREAIALRHSVGWTRSDHIRCVRLEGPGAFDALDRVCPRELYLRNGQMLLTVFLNPEGQVIADVLVCNDDDEFILCVEGMDDAALTGFLQEHTGRTDTQIVSLAESHAVVSLNGPYSWEVLSELAGATLIGLPYMTFYHAGSWAVMRSGKTGEYGYDILLPVGEVDGLLDQLDSLKEKFEIVEIGLDALDQCALENCFFSIRREGAATRDPRQLQLHWRFSSRKQYVGSDSLGHTADQPITHRTTTLIAAEAMNAGDEVYLDGKIVGKIANAGHCWHRSESIALALIEARVAYPGIDGFCVGAVDGAAARSVSPPALNNRSLYMNPQIHSFAMRDEVDFPPLVLEGWP
jgi:glycine cleavage system aminomethyltransferase T